MVTLLNFIESAHERGNTLASSIDELLEKIKISVYDGNWGGKKRLESALKQFASNKLNGALIVVLTIDLFSKVNLKYGK